MNNTFCQNSFYVRFTSKPFQDYKDYLQATDNNFQKYIEKYMEKEIKYASYSLYNCYFINKKCDYKISQALLKYAIRSSTRTTPYSLLAGVLNGHFSNHENFDLSNIKFHLKVDLEWLFNIIPYLEKEIDNNLFIIKNPNILIEEERIINYWTTCFYSDNNFNNKNIVINNTNAVKLILEYCTNYIKKSDLISRVNQEYPNIPSLTIKKLVNQLLKFEILISNLRCSLVNNNYLFSIINIIEASKYNTKTGNLLKYLSKNIDHINNMQDLSNVDKLKTKMMTIYNSSNYFHIDLFSENIITLPHNIKKDIDEYLLFLLYFSKTKNIYTRYVTKFIDKYGNSFVPINIVLDKETGIGLPDNSDIIHTQENYVCQLILDKIIDAPNNKIIDLYDKSHDYNLNNDISIEAELSLFVLKENNNYQYIASPMIGSNNLNESYGRFSYLFTNNLHEKNQNIDHVEITYIPKKARIANVLNCQSDSRYILSYGIDNQFNEKQQINLSDILISVKNDIFVFINKKTGKEIKFTFTNKTNSIFMPKDLHFLITASNNKRSILGVYDDIYKLKQEVFYLPEIRFKNIIISPRCWNINKILSKNINLSSFNHFKIFIKNLIKKYSIKNDIYIEYTDNRLLFNLSNDLHLHTIYNLIKRNNKIFLTESLFTENNLLLKKNEKKYIGEFVFQISNNSINRKKMIGQNENIIKYILNPISQRTFYPFDKWIYAIVNIRIENQNYFLINYLHPFLKLLKSEKKINYYFFLRYIDGSSSIRLRINSSNTKDVIHRLNLFFKTYIDNEIIQHYSYNPYERELERYGDKTIATIEKIFYLNSSYVIEIIKEKEDGLIKYTYDELYIISFIKFLYDVDFNSIYTCFRDQIVSKQHRKEFRILRKKILPLLCEDSSWKELRKHNDGIRLYILSEKYHKKNKEYWNYINNITTNTEMQNSIMLSLAHMFFNRLIGIDREKEIKIMSYISNLIRSLEGKNKYGKS